MPASPGAVRTTYELPLRPSQDELSNEGAFTFVPLLFEIGGISKVPEATRRPSQQLLVVDYPFERDPR